MLVQGIRQFSIKTFNHTVKQVIGDNDYGISFRRLWRRLWLWVHALFRTNARRSDTRQGWGGGEHTHNPF